MSVYSSFYDHIARYVNNMSICYTFICILGMSSQIVKVVYYSYYLKLDSAT